MRDRISTRDAALCAALAAAAYLTARPPRAVPPLAPGRPDSAPRAASTPVGREDSARDWRDALNAGGPPGEAPGAANLSAGDFARILSARALGMAGEDGARAPTASASRLSRGGRDDSAMAGPRGAVAASRRRGRELRRDPSGAAGLASGGETESPKPVPDPSAEGSPQRARRREDRRAARGAFRRAPLDEEEGSDGAVDLRRARRRAASLFEPASGPGRVRHRRPPRTPRFRPLRLSQLLGGKALRPPPAALRPPVGLAGLALKRPRLDASGKTVPEPSRELGAIETVAPDEIAADRRRGAHWDAQTWHEKRAHGLARRGGWIWLYKDGGRWWGLVERTPLARHQNLWWLRENGVWLILHEGEPWAWRHFQDWGGDGLFHPGTGTEIVYSPDLARAAVITPGEGAVVYDARSGAELGRIPEYAMPARRRPRAPKSLSLP